MQVEKFIEALGAEFYTGVPDSQLKAVCDCLYSKYGINPKHHIIAANEGNCVGLAAGYHLATGKTPVVYMQNSGEGNIVNPVASLLNSRVYAIPMIFIIGWRGEPGVHDEPQHIFQGEITLKLLELLNIKYTIVDSQLTEAELKTIIHEYKRVLSRGKSVAYVIKKDAFIPAHKVEYSNDNILLREEIIEEITKISGEDPIISTTGKASRELFEIREKRNQGHQYDFLTVGSMGHSSSIALGVAINCPSKKVWCIDGDGAALMHMGAMAVVGSSGPNNLVHIVINNGAHETVGGMPTVMGNTDICKIAEACGYKRIYCVESKDNLVNTLLEVKSANELTFVEIKAKIGSRSDLGRPTSTPLENKNNFMKTFVK